MEKDAPRRKAKSEIVYLLRKLPLPVKESLSKEEVDAILFEDIWPDYPSDEDFFYNEDDY